MCKDILRGFRFFKCFYKNSNVNLKVKFWVLVTVAFILKLIQLS